MARRLWSAVGTLALGLVLLGLALDRDVGAQQPGAAPTVVAKECTAIVSIEGKDNFAAYCAVCHGTDGRGRGPASPALKMPVPDLTLLAARNAGRFDELAVRDLIESGGRMPAVHGTVDMPVWGPLFRSVDSHWAVAHLRLNNLVKYLESIQRRS
jgi:mono/diheme cytochrome c family protein